jgi:hypothetical protein
VTPAHLAVTRACGVAARISFSSERRGVAGRGVFSDALVSFDPQCLAHHRPVSRVEAAHDRSTHLSMREIVRRIMFASLRVRTGGACFRRRRLPAVRPSCCHVGGIATNPCPRSSGDPSFDVRTSEARGCASCFSLLGAERGPRPPSSVHSRERPSAFASAFAPSLLSEPRHGHHGRHDGRPPG